MTGKKITMLVALALMTMSELQAATPYAGQQLREIKALSLQDVQGLQQGRGMGMAKAAELNHYPGPKHVLELATELGLTKEQQKQTQVIFASMQQEARRLGKKIIHLEKKLDRLFTSEAITHKSLQDLTDTIGQRRGQLRRLHLQAHLQQRQILTPTQLASYDKLRGYGQAGHQQHEHTH